MPSVLFVCTANRIRSPLAEYLFRRALPPAGEEIVDWKVASAGTWTRAGLPVMPLALQAGADLGLDLSAHRSTPIEDVDLASYGVIVAMEQGQREALAFEAPAEAERIHLLAKLASGLTYDVADPVGGPVSAYVTAANELDRLIGVAAPRIIELARG